jgi:hypothetical protein
LAPTIYNYVTFVQARQQLADRLDDDGEVFWSDAELGQYIVEAIRTWNAFTSFWRQDFTFQLQQGVVWYDLTNATALPNTLRPYTVTDAALYVLMEYHLLEPPSGVNPWTGSLQFDAQSLINSVQRCRDELLSLTGCTLTVRQVPAVLGRVILPDIVLDVRRMAYMPTVVLGSGYGLGLYGSGLYSSNVASAKGTSTMWPEDVWAQDSFQPTFRQKSPGVPITYMMSTQPPISFDVDRPPNAAGAYELITVEAGGALSAATPSTLLVPDDWTHVIKWGSLADLLSRESVAADPLRAAYCTERYQMGLKMLSCASVMLDLRINNVPLLLDSVRDVDLYAATWEGQAQGPPTVGAHMGLNLLAFNPPDGGNYSVTATVVQNAPVPVLNTDPVQVSRGDLDAIIGYAQHLAAFKQGGAEFTASIPLFKEFLEQAQSYGLKLAELGEFTSRIYSLSDREKQMNPILAPTASDMSPETPMEISGE